MSKLLTVFGATGLQGGSLIDYVVKHAKLSKIYKLRGVTRDVSKPAAVALKEKGSLAHTLYLLLPIVSEFLGYPDAAAANPILMFPLSDWEKASAAVEVAQGKAIADAAVVAGATLLIWSSLPNVTKMSNGKLSGMHHFDSKAEVETYIRGLPIKSTFYMAGFYMQNMQTIFKPNSVSDFSSSSF